MWVKTAASHSHFLFWCHVSMINIKKPFFFLVFPFCLFFFYICVFLLLKHSVLQLRLYQKQMWRCARVEEMRKVSSKDQIRGKWVITSQDRASAGNGICIVVVAGESFPQERLKSSANWPESRWKQEIISGWEGAKIHRMLRGLLLNRGNTSQRFHWFGHMQHIDVSMICLICS